MSWETELAFAEHLADLADEISMRYFRKRDTIARAKQDGTPVTEADELIEETLRREIAAAYPGHGILGEEQGGDDDDAGTRWIIDPIDGTKNFSWGIRNWATLLALEVDAQIVCGVVSAPSLTERYTARRGGGAQRNGDAIGVSVIDEIGNARLGFTTVRAFEDKGYGDTFRQLVQRVAEDRGIGDFLGHVLVAAGALDVMIEPSLAPWDIGPLIVIAEEAGGRLTNFRGEATIYGGSVLTSNGRLHEPFLELLSAGT